MAAPTDAQAVHRAVLVLEDALEQEYPGESLDPEALRTALAELKRLQAMEERAEAATHLQPQLYPNTDYWTGAVRTSRYILTGEDSNDG